MYKRCWVLFGLLLALTMPPLMAQEDEMPVFPFAAIHNDELWLYGFGDAPQKVVLNVETNQEFEIQQRPLVWSDDGQDLYFSVYLTDNLFFPIMRTDRSGTPAEVIIPQTTFWYGPEYSSGDLIYAAINRDVRYESVEIYPYGEGVNAVFAPVAHEIYRLPLNTAADPEYLGVFAQGVDCNGGPYNLADAIYNTELNFRGNPITLKPSPYGLIHSFTCWGGGTAILDPETGTDTLLGNLLRRVQVSPGGGELIGIDDTRDDLTVNPQALLLRYVDLATLETRVLPTAEEPDQVAWGAAESGLIFYSVLTPAEGFDLTEAEEDRLMEVTNNFFGDGARNITRIRRHNLQTGEDAEVYSADAYAIGRMTATPDGRYLLFSQIPNMDGVVEAILTADDPNAEGFMAGLWEMLQPNVYALDLQTGETLLLAEHIYWFSLNAAAYMENLR